MPWFTMTLTLDSFAPAVEPLLVTALSFFVAVLILDLFDISRPRGDSIGVSGALWAAALLHLGPAYSAAICLGALVFAHGLRKDRRFISRLFGGLGTRVAALSLATVTAVAMGLNGSVGNRYDVAIVVPAVFLLGDLAAAQAIAAISTGRPVGRLVRGNLVTQAPLLIAEWSASVLLLITVEGMGSWSLVPVVALLLLIRQSYALLMSIRETYRTTVEVLVEAAEGQDRRLLGHAERTAEIARRIAARMGLTVARVELVSYAALLHDVDAIRDNVQHLGHFGSGHSSALFEGVDFFADVLPILRICDGDSGEHCTVNEKDLLAGLIVALASDADAAESKDVASVHSGSLVARVAPHVPSSVKAAVVAAALSLGYKIPAVS